MTFTDMDLDREYDIHTAAEEAASTTRTREGGYDYRYNLALPAATRAIREGATHKQAVKAAKAAIRRNAR